MNTSYVKEFTKGIFKENPVFVIVLGLCPTLAVTTSLINGLAMGVATTFVLVCSNVMVSASRKVIPKQIRIPCFIVIIASFVTTIEILMSAYLPPEVNQQLGIFIPLIVVNCIILGRAEAFAKRNSVFRSFLDGLGIGIGFIVALSLISGIRELLGSGTLLGVTFSKDFVPVSIMIMAPGAFLVIGLLIGFFNWVQRKREQAREQQIVGAE